VEIQTKNDIHDHSDDNYDYHSNHRLHQQQHHYEEEIESIRSIQINSMRNKLSSLSSSLTASLSVSLSPSAQLRSSPISSSDNISMILTNHSFLPYLLDEIASRIDFVVYFRSLCSGKN